MIKFWNHLVCFLYITKTSHNSPSVLQQSFKSHRSTHTHTPPPPTKPFINVTYKKQMNFMFCAGKLTDMKLNLRTVQVCAETFKVNIGSVDPASSGEVLWFRFRTPSCKVFVQGRVNVGECVQLSPSPCCLLESVHTKKVLSSPFPLTLIRPRHSHE